MFEVVSTIGNFILVFVVAVAAGYLIGGAIRWTRHHLSPVPAGCALTLIAPSGYKYRARLIRSHSSTWEVSAPLLKGVFVPFRAGERMLVEAPSAFGVHRFQTEVLERVEDSKTFLLRGPSNVKLEERRSEKRVNFANDVQIHVQNSEGRLLNLSTAGAKIVSPVEVCPGDAICIEMPGGATARAWVLNVAPSCIGVFRGIEARVLWFDPLPELTVRALSPR